MREFWGGAGPCDWIDDDLEATPTTVVVITFIGNNLTDCMLDGQPLRHPRFDADLEVEGINAVYREYAATIRHVSNLDAAPTTLRVSIEQVATSPRTSGITAWVSPFLTTRGVADVCDTPWS